MIDVALPVPTSLSPSRIEAFTSCPLAFRFSSIDKLPEPSSVHAIKGSLVHRALELLFCAPAAQRTLHEGLNALDRAMTELYADEEWCRLALETDDEAAFLDDAERLVRRYFEMEDPQKVHEIGLELRLEVAVGDLTLRGIIDRLELDDGELVVTDYKTGRPPSINREQGRLGGVHFYAFLCEQLFGRRPSRVQLLYLSTGEFIVAHPSDNSIRFLPKRTSAVWQAVERACLNEEFRARPGPLCAHCAYQQWCPAFGGDPTRAAVEAPIAFGLAAA